MSGANTWRQTVKDGFKRLAMHAGVDVLYISPSGTTCEPRVLYSMPSTMVSGGMQVSFEHSIEYDHDDLPGLEYGSSLLVDGEQFTVREAVPADDDGVTFRAVLTKVNDG